MHHDHNQSPLHNTQRLELNLRARMLRDPVWMDQGQPGSHLTTRARGLRFRIDLSKQREQPGLVALSCGTGDMSEM